jgi:hypothetical protein
LPEYDCVFYTKRFWDQDVRQRVSLRESAYVRHGYDAVIHRPIELEERDQARYQSDAVVIATHTKYKEEVLHELLGLRPRLKLTVWVRRAGGRSMNSEGLAILRRRSGTATIAERFLAGRTREPPGDFLRRYSTLSDGIELSEK